MSRAANLPDWSCPKIDEAQRALSAAEDHFAELDQFGDPDNLEQTMADGRAALEYVREINDQLRKAAEQFANEADQLELDAQDDD